ncbi:MAG: hypothetical protein QOJ92_2441, partial [Frankiales bacterium]|nr:hypothetical protein [Frankiales bacterium]
SAAPAAGDGAASGQVVYVPTSVAGYNVGMGVGEEAASKVRPSSLDGYVSLTPVGTSIVLNVDDYGIADGKSVRVGIAQSTGNSPSYYQEACVPVRTPWQVSGLTAGTVVHVGVIGATDEYDHLLSGLCSGRAVGGELSFGGALWTPYSDFAGQAGSQFDTDGFARAAGCSVSTEGLAPGQSGSCGFTATGLGGWVITYDGLGAFAGDYTTDVTVTVVSAGRSYRSHQDCSSQALREGDRVLVTIQQYDHGYSQHTVHAGRDARC